MQKPIVSLYIAIEKEELLGNGIFVEYDEITDVEKISILMKIPYACGNFHEKKKFTVYSAIGFQYIVDASDTGDDGHFVEVDDFQKYIFIGRVF